MIRMKFYIPIILIILSCTQPELSNTIPIVSLNQSQPIKDNLNAMLSEVELIPLTGLGEYITRIEKIIFDTISNNYFVLARTDSGKSVFCFDKGGAFSHIITSEAEGPERGKELTDFVVERESIVIFSNAEMSAYRYDKKGNFISRDRIDLFGAEFEYFLNDGKINYAMYVNNNFMPDYGSYNLLMFDAKWSLKHKHATYTGVVDMGFEMSGFLERSEQLLFSPFFSDTIFGVNNDELLPLLSFSFGSQKLLVEDCKELNEVFDQLSSRTYLTKSALISDSIVIGLYVKKGDIQCYATNLITGTYITTEKAICSIDRSLFYTNQHIFWTGDKFGTFMDSESIEEQQKINEESSCYSSTILSSLDTTGIGTIIKFKPNF